MNSYRILSGLDPADYGSSKIAVAMSGGVDSSLSAILLKEAGFDVVGLTMSLWNYEHSGGQNNERGCCDLSTFEDARKVAHSAGIPHYTVNLRDVFERIVVDDFIAEYLNGRTPNPCVRCNTYLKWEALTDKARLLGCDLIATGHYARIARHDDGAHSLLAGVDTGKDQSYFLWGLDSKKLSTTLFPLGGMTKNDTRREAEKRGLATAKRRDSQEICFIPDNDYGRFLRERFPGDIPEQLREGDVKTVSGECVGRHRGSAFYTIGQRRGIGVALGRPIYVTGVDTKSNAVTIGDEKDLYSGRMSVTGIVWGGGKTPDGQFSCSVRIRYRHKGAEAHVTPSGDTADVVFNESQRAVTPGQSAVFYDGDMVLGGGIIADTLSASMQEMT